MAANVVQNCVICEKNAGILLCTGCNRTFCFKHVNEHRQDIEKNLDHLIDQENEFENNLLNKNDSHHLFNEIDQWKKDSIEHIKQVAKKTKEDLRILINRSSEYLFNDLKLIKENLRLLKESEDFSEFQFNRLKDQFDQLKNQINSFVLIKSDNSFLLKIEKEQTNAIVILTPVIPIEKSRFSIEESHSKKEGSIVIHSIDPYGYFLIIEHTGLTTMKDQDMCGWIIKRSIDSSREIIYRFPNDFILKCQSMIQILSREASRTIYSYEKRNILIADSILTWSTGANIINTLMDPNGDDKHILIQKYLS